MPLSTPKKAAAPEMAAPSENASSEGSAGVDPPARTADAILALMPEMMHLLGKSLEFKIPKPDLTLAQYRLLVAAHMAGSSSMRALSQALGISMPAATEGVDRLVREGLVQRDGDPNDRRVVRVSLTARGAQAASHCQQARRSQWIGLLSHLDNEERQDMVEHLQRFIDLMRLAGARSEQAAPPLSDR